MKLSTNMFLDNRTKPTEFQGHRSGQGHMGFGVFFCVRAAAATRGQYLALSKAW